MFCARLVNPPEHDPGLLVELPNQPGSYLVDCGNLLALQIRDILKVRRLMVSHCHIDHFFGFDHLLRMQLFCRHTLEVYGPPGILKYVRAKLGGYAWNLVSESGFGVQVHELHADRCLTQNLPCHTGFVPEEPESWGSYPIVLPEGPRLEFGALEHGVDCLAYALRWPERWRVDKAALLQVGLVPGAWLEELKSRDQGSLEVEGRTRPIEEWRSLLLQRISGPSLGYVTDTLLSKPVMKRLIALMQGVDELWCEAAYLHSERDKAVEHLHMTARQAGRLAKEAGVGRLHLFHHSRRYPKGSEHLEEAREVFAAAAPAPVYSG